jgi:hypothetical protein
VESFLAVVNRYLEVPELTPEILWEFVHHITHSGTYKKKFFTRDIDVCFNHIGMIR